MQSSSDKKAVLEAGVTSIQSFPRDAHNKSFYDQTSFRTKARNGMKPLQRALAREWEEETYLSWLQDSSSCTLGGISSACTDRYSR